MAQTANLSITKLEGSDVVDYEYFNRTFETIDAALADYVVEKSGPNTGIASWWWRKWNSGRMECGIDNKMIDGSFKMSPWGTMYASQDLTFGNYPQTFVTNSRPYANITFNYAAVTGMSCYIAQNTQSGATASPPFKIIDPLLSTSINKPQCGIFCCGRWK